MDEKCYTPGNLESTKQEIEAIHRSQEHLVKQLRIYRLSCKEISEVTGLTLPEVRRLI